MAAQCAAARQHNTLSIVTLGATAQARHTARFRTRRRDFITKKMKKRLTTEVKKCSKVPRLLSVMMGWKWSISDRALNKISQCLAGEDPYKGLLLVESVF